MAGGRIGLSDVLGTGRLWARFLTPGVQVPKYKIPSLVVPGEHGASNFKHAEPHFWVTYNNKPPAGSYHIALPGYDGSATPRPKLASQTRLLGMAETCAQKL